MSMSCVNGTCGDHLQWRYDHYTGTLTIEGFGDMKDFVHYYDYDGEHVGSKWGNNDIKAVILPIGLTSIGNFAFEDCKSLSSVIIPSNVATIGESAFKGCESLRSIIIPDSVATIGKSAFKGCHQLSSVELSSSITSISDSLFAYCSSLGSIVIPNEVTTIGKFAFDGCKSLLSIAIPDSVTHIGHLAFGSCDSLRTIFVPASVVKLDGRPFSDCKSLLSIEVDKLNANYSSTEGVLFDKKQDLLLQFPGGKNDYLYTIPHGVKKIEDFSFWGSKITKIDIPDSVTSIGECAFVGSSLSTVIIPNSVTKISDTAFDSCKQLLYVVIPASLTEIDFNYGRSFFSNCESLKSITVDDGNPIFSSQDGILFDKECKTILRYPSNKIGNNYDIPEGVEHLGYSVFEKCSHLTNVTIPDSVISIGVNAFFGCSSLKQIIIPNSVKYLSDYSFANCSSLVFVILSNKITSIGSGTFSGCSSMVSIFIPDSVLSIHENAFNGCTSLEPIRVSDSVTRFKDPWDYGSVFEWLEDVVKVQNNQQIENKNEIMKPRCDISKSKFKPIEGPGIKFDDIAGLDDVKERIYETVILPIKRPDLYESMKIQTGDGILLYGPPGTGKTMFAQAVATEINAPFFAVNGSDFESPLPGETEKNIKELFETARSFDTSVIFFDEFESIGMSRDIGFNQDIYGRIVTELLSQMQGFNKSASTIILLAATNRPWDIDKALLRPGRFGSHIYIGLPNEESRRHIVQNQFKKIPMESNVNLEELVLKTEGFNGADVAEICKRIKLNAIRRNINNSDVVVSKQDVDKALQQVHPSVKGEDIQRYREFAEK